MGRNFIKDWRKKQVKKIINKEKMYTVLKRAVSDFYDQKTWPEKVKKVMNVDFGWTKSAKEYIKMYDELLG